MKKIAVMALAGVFALAGCSAPHLAPTSTQDNYGLTDMEVAGVAADLLRESFPSEMHGTTIEDLAELMYTFCDLVDQGMTLEDYLMLTKDAGIDIEFAGAVAGVSVASYCPEHESTLLD